MNQAESPADQPVTDLIEFLFKRAQRQVNDYYFEDAVDTCKELLRRLSTEPIKEAKAHGFLGDLYLLMRDVPAAERHLRQAVNRSPDKGEYHYLMGCALTMESRWAEAIDFFKTANELMPQSAEVLRGLGWATHCTGDYPAAESSLRTSVTLDPDNVATLNDLAVCLMTQNRYGEAREVIITALDILPDDERLVETRETISRLMVEFNSGLDKKERASRAIGSRGYPSPSYSKVEDCFDRSLRRHALSESLTAAAKEFWLERVLDLRPRIRSVKVWAAAVELRVRRNQGEIVSFVDIAGLYGVGASSVSTAFRKLTSEES